MLLLEFLRQLQAHETVVPPDLLPLLLSFKDAEIRRRLVAVLGERGAWLCRQNPDYAWALTATAEQTTCDALELKLRFDEGTIEERCQALEAMRAMDPDGGRDWVEAVLPREKHGNRVKLLKSLRTGLSDRDEPFLERCLDDRSPAVGQAAAGLLCELPGSALAGRMLTRASAMLAVEKEGLVFKKVRIVCTPPAEVEPDWVRDGFSKKRKRASACALPWLSTCSGKCLLHTGPGFSASSRKH